MTFDKKDKWKNWKRKKRVITRKHSKGFAIGDLLGGSINKAGIGFQITIANVIVATNAYLDEVLSPAQRGDVKAAHVKNKILTIHCLNSPSSHFIGRQSEKLFDFVKRRVPACDVEEVRTRIVDKFPSSEL